MILFLKWNVLYTQRSIYTDLVCKFQLWTQPTSQPPPPPPKKNKKTHSPERAKQRIAIPSFKCASRIQYSIPMMENQTKREGWSKCKLPRGCIKYLVIHQSILPDKIRPGKYTLHKKWSFPLRISSQETADLATFTKKILNGKLHFLRSDKSGTKPNI